jgi:hypothetical protein
MRRDNAAQGATEGAMAASTTSASLAHVLWLGGSPCAGKSSISEALAVKYQTIAYHFDRMEPQHIARSDATTNPELMAFLAFAMDQRWLTRSPDEMARNAIASWKARFPLVLEDLHALPADRLIVAEGPGLFPDIVAPLLTNSRQAVWLVTSEALCTAVRQQRDGGTAAARRQRPGDERPRAGSAQYHRA